MNATAGAVNATVKSGVGGTLMVVATTVVSALLVSTDSAMVLAGSTTAAEAALVTVPAVPGAITSTVSTAGVKVVTVPDEKVTTPPSCVAVKPVVPTLLAL